MAQQQVKKMNVVQLTSLTAINMIGSGIIMLPSQLAAVGTMSILSWIVTALGATALAYGFAKAGMFSKKDGGMGGYTEYAFGKGGNFMSNYAYCVSLVISNVAISVSITGYLTVFLGIKLPPVTTTLWIIAIIWITTVLNFGGASITGKIGSVTIWGTIGPIIILCIIGWFWFSPDMYAAAWNPNHLGLFDGVKQSITMTLWAFLGLESASANMDAVENPQRDVPIACLGGTIGAAIVYIISTNVIAGIVPNAQILQSTAPFGLVFATMFTPVVGKIVMGLMILACFGSLLAWQFTLSQVFKDSAKQGYFPKIFTKVTKQDAPIIGMIILAILQTLIALMTISPNLNKQFQVIVNLAVVCNLVPYILSMASVKTIQSIEGVAANKAKIGNAVALIAGIYSLYALYSAGPAAMLGGGIVSLAGWTLYGLVAPRFAKDEFTVNQKKAN